MQSSASCRSRLELSSKSRLRYNRERALYSLPSKSIFVCFFCSHFDIYDAAPSKAFMQTTSVAAQPAGPPPPPGFKKYEKSSGAGGPGGGLAG